MNSIDELAFVEIYQQSNWDMKQLHITQKLRLVNWGNCSGRFYFNHYAAFYKEIESERFFAHKALVLDDHGVLVLIGDPTKFEFSTETSLVNGLNQAGTFVTMNFNCRSNDYARQRVRSFKKWMH